MFWQPCYAAAAKFFKKVEESARFARKPSDHVDCLTA
jgi:hypothetical protein